MSLPNKQPKRNRARRPSGSSSKGKELPSTVDAGGASNAQMATTEILEKAVERGISQCAAYLASIQGPDGAYSGGTQAGPRATADIFVVRHHIGALPEDDRRDGRAFLASRQRADGAFPAYDGAPEGDMDATCACYAALVVTGMEPGSEALTKAWAWIEQRGGFGKAGLTAQLTLVLAGAMPPHALPTVPVNWVLGGPLVDRWLSRRLLSGINLMLHALPATMRALKRELEPTKRVKLVDKIADKRVIQYLTDRQNPSGDWFGLPTFTCVVVACLHSLGVSLSDPRMRRALASLEHLEVRDGTVGMFYNVWPAKLWNTSEVARSLMQAGVSVHDDAVHKAITFLIDHQTKVSAPRDLDNHPRNSPGFGGWPFEQYNEFGQDCDSTASVLLTLHMAKQRGAENLGIQRAIRRGLEWLLPMQNDDGGFPAFTHECTSKPAGALSIDPFATLVNLNPLQLVLQPPPELGDPATADLSARVLATLKELDFPSKKKVRADIANFLFAQQVPRTGQWWGRWETNFLPGTATVVFGLCANGMADSLPVRRAVQWMLGRQNADGGFGETEDSYANLLLAGQGPSNVPVTALTVRALVAAGYAHHEATAAAVRYLLDQQNGEGRFSSHDFLGVVFWPWPFFRLALIAQYWGLAALCEYRDQITGEVSK